MPLRGRHGLSEHAQRRTVCRLGSADFISAKDLYWLWRKARQGQTRPDKARQGQTRPRKARQGRARRNKHYFSYEEISSIIRTSFASWDLYWLWRKARQGQTRPDKARQGRARPDKAAHAETSTIFHTRKSVVSYVRHLLRGIVLVVAQGQTRPDKAAQGQTRPRTPKQALFSIRGSQ